jgi:hypothetical protein
MEVKGVENGEGAKREAGCWVPHYFGVIFLIILSGMIFCRFKLEVKGGGCPAPFGMGVLLKFRFE